MLGGQIPGGGTSVREAWEPLRQAGASARMMLVAAAAEQWNVPAAEIRAENGQLTHGERKASYGSLAASAAKQPVPKDVPLKSADKFTVIGRPLARPASADTSAGRTGPRGYRATASMAGAPSSSRKGGAARPPQLRA